MSKKVAPFDYLVQENPHNEDHYIIWKVPEGDPRDTFTDRYDLIVPNGGDCAEEDLWCDCPGFRVQQYSKHLHKHVRIVVHFCEEHDALGLARYKLTKDNAPDFIKMETA